MRDQQINPIAPHENPCKPAHEGAERTRTAVSVRSIVWVRMTPFVNDPCFFVYVIAFDQDVFGICATREEAKASLVRQIAEGGPAWEDCKVERWRVNGTPEIPPARVAT